MSEIAFTVWEFVRVMVRLEAAAEGDPKGPQAALLAEWQDIWSELDAELARLGESDPDSMQALMLDHDLRVDLPAMQRPALIRTLDEVVAEMRSATDGVDADLRAALTAEAEALDALRRRLAKTD
ncbi:MAG: hypothetical protein AB7G39_05305 [Alphaproteobacteria bacterium]